MKHLLLVFLVILAPAVCIGQELQSTNKWLTIDKWRGTFERSYEIKGEKKLEYWTEILTYREVTSGSVNLYDKYVDSPYSASWAGTTKGTTTIYVERTWNIAGTVYTVKGKGSSSFNMSMEDAPETGLYIDIESGTYGFHAGGSPEKKIELTGEYSDKQVISQIENPVVRDLFMGMIDDMEKNPGSIGGLVMLDTIQQQTTDFLAGNIEEEEAPKLPAKPGTLSSNTSYKRGNITSGMNWTLTPGGDSPPKYILTVENKSDYKSFIPEKGSLLQLKVFTKDNDALPVNIRIRLTEVSNEPGECLNCGDENDKSDDLVFLFPQQLQKVDGHTIQTYSPVKELSVDLECLDYGAYGTIVAEIEFDDVWIEVENDIDQNTELPFPWDENYNRIADAWEKSQGILSKNFDSYDDYEDKPKLDGAIGDGLSVYEEYRGLIAKGSHRRLNPKEKELIVENRIGSKIQGGLSLFQNASGIKVIELEKDDLPDNRQVNLNSSYGKNIDQFGIIIEEEPGSTSDATGGECRPADIHRKTPKLTEKIVLYSGFLNNSYANLSADAQSLTSPADFNQTWQMKINQSVAHEIGHAVGAQHHTLRTEGVTDNFRYSLHQNSFERAFDEQGNQLTNYPVTINPPSGYDHGLASGNVDCIMCYTDFYYWVKRMEKLPGESQSRVVFRRYSPPGIPGSFCTSGAATGVNTQKNGFGDADQGLGNCLGQMRVIDITR